MPTVRREEAGIGLLWRRRAAWDEPLDHVTLV